MEKESWGIRKLKDKVGILKWEKGRTKCVSLKSWYTLNVEGYFLMKFIVKNILVDIPYEIHKIWIFGKSILLPW